MSQIKLIESWFKGGELWLVEVLQEKSNVNMQKNAEAIQFGLATVNSVNVLIVGIINIKIQKE